MTFHSILWSLSNLHSTLVLRCIELKSDMDLPWGNGISHINGCYGNYVAVATKVIP